MNEWLHTISHTWAGIACRLRRRGALTGLFVLLSIGLVEPLACIIHCEFSEFLAIPTTSIAQAHHNHAHHVAVAADASTTATSSAPQQETLLCAQVHSNKPHPGTPQSGMPQPFHEMVVLLGVLLVAVSIIVRSLPSATDPPRTRFIAPPLRPPILFA